MTPDSSYIASHAVSWLDDFLVWLFSEACRCCTNFPNSTYCPPNDQPPCYAEGEDYSGVSETCKDCTACFLHSDLIGTTQFKEKLPWFLNSSPSADCAKGDHGAYKSSVDLEGYASGIIKASEFCTYHTPLNKQNDFVNTMRVARDVAALSFRFFKDLSFPIFKQYLDYLENNVD